MKELYIGDVWVCRRGKHQAYFMLTDAGPGPSLSGALVRPAGWDMTPTNRDFYSEYVHAGQDSVVSTWCTIPLMREHLHRLDGSMDDAVVDAAMLDAFLSVGVGERRTLSTTKRWQQCQGSYQQDDFSLQASWSCGIIPPWPELFLISERLWDVFGHHTLNTLYPA